MLEGTGTVSIIAQRSYQNKRLCQNNYVRLVHRPAHVIRGKQGEGNW